MKDSDLLYPGAFSQIVYKFVGDPLNIYGGNLLGSYKMSDTFSVPAISIENRSPSVLETTGIEIIVEALPRNVMIESANESGLSLNLEWGLYVVNKTTSDVNFPRVLLRLLQCFNTGEAHLLNTEDKVGNSSQFFYIVPMRLNIASYPNDSYGICDFVLPDIPCLPDLPRDSSYYENLDFGVN